MIKTAAKIFAKPQSVQNSIHRDWTPIASSVTKKLNFNNRRCSHSTIDPHDIFQANPKIAHSYWDRDGFFKSLHAFNHIRVPYFRDAILDTVRSDKFSTCLKGKKILDVGCGGGLVSEGLAMFGAEVTGVDTCKALLSLADDHSSKTTRLADNKPTYILSTVEEHSSKYPETYDAIIASEVIEHVTEKDLFVESCVRATKPGGKLFFTTPNKTRFAQFYIIYTFENILRCYPKNAHQFEKFMRPIELQYMLEMNDCCVESIKGYFYYPWNNTWEWTDSKMFSFAIEAVKSK
ncbi:ubiquinone biosynthesis O-methyltransferase [Bicyclus anynana]|uniref:Ubiquinone biosynthesis O-methyltransferase n=1 Tax=Bicyclus anynana TaxID=110368 RepID=A0ABM3LGZ9_BICAN|nr:ubiquinone biosynthesis O-methyltransferase [Bicyclus anynana]XP_052738348.1 ubiquinone biosynthesis O-methyltransferase [Bicyclus anynana]XP_052738349.1 ubiquinone biosynthesis O-methyltransferase [Bicyclus anynana]